MCSTPHSCRSSGPRCFSSTVPHGLVSPAAELRSIFREIPLLNSRQHLCPVAYSGRSRRPRCSSISLLRGCLPRSEIINGTDIAPACVDRSLCSCPYFRLSIIIYSVPDGCRSSVSLCSFMSPCECICPPAITKGSCVTSAGAGTILVEQPLRTSRQNVVLAWICATCCVVMIIIACPQSPYRTVNYQQWQVTVRSGGAHTRYSSPSRILRAFPSRRSVQLRHFWYGQESSARPGLHRSSAAGRSPKYTTGIPLETSSYTSFLSTT